VEWVLDWSDTRGVDYELDVDRQDSEAREVSGGVARSDLGGGGPLFHVEQFESGLDLGAEDMVLGEMDRAGSAMKSLSADADADADGAGLSGVDQAMGARMFAHEVNNLVMGISGRAQRAMVSGEPEMVGRALEMAADLGVQIRGLCAVFLDGSDCDIAGRLDVSQVIGAHGFARVSACEYLDFERVSWVVEVDEGIDDIGGVPMGAGMFGQVLMNLYRNALAGIARGVDSDTGCSGGGGGYGGVVGTIRLRVMRFDGVGGGNGIVVRVEDSGVGFGGGGRGAKDGVGGGYGLGLKVCRELCGRCGGRVEVGASGMLGGGRVDVVFD
tara:strand:- start:2211 stop:3191 length:981 start_codon:yes stop_codon:yes gene_type:complete